VVIDIEPIRERFSAVAPFLDERGRRLVAAAEAFAAGYGGIAAVAMATGIAPSTIGRGLKELAWEEPSERVRAMGARTLRLNDADQPWNLPLTLNSPGSPCRRAVTVSGLSPGQGSGQLTRDNFRLSLGQKDLAAPQGLRQG
jgi:hypothetical protein